MEAIAFVVFSEVVQTWLCPTDVVALLDVLFVVDDPFLVKLRVYISIIEGQTLEVTLMIIRNFLFKLILIFLVSFIVFLVVNCPFFVEFAEHFFFVIFGFIHLGDSVGC